MPEALHVSAPLSRCAFSSRSHGATCENSTVVSKPACAMSGGLVHRRLREIHARTSGAPRERAVAASNGRALSLRAVRASERRPGRVSDPCVWPQNDLGLDWHVRRGPELPKSAVLFYFDTYCM